MDLLEYYRPMSSFEVAVRDIYLRHAPRLKGDISALTSQQLIQLREDMAPEIQELMQQNNGFYQHSKPEVILEMIHHGDMHCLNAIFSPYYPRYDPVPWHVCQHYEVQCQLFGQSIVCIGSSTILLKAGDVLLIPPGVWQTGGVFDDQGILRSFRIKPADVQRNLSALLDCSCGLSEFFTRTVSGTLTSAWRLYHMGAQHNLGRWMDWLEEIFLSRDPLSRAKEASFLLHLFSDLERIAGAQAEQRLAETEDDEASRILSYLQLHLRSISRSSLAEHFNYSDRQITRIIEKHTGMNFAVYLRRIRLQHIANRLTYSDQSIAEAVASGGYKNNAYFYRQFRELFGCTPQEYRDRSRPATKKELTDR